MTSVLTTIIVFILNGYITFTDSLANIVAAAFGIEHSITIESLPTESAAANEEVPVLNKVPSVYELGGVLPDILIKNAAYQQAAVGDGLLVDASATKHSLDEALVNILCTYTTDTYIRTNTGTGFLVSRTGVILTNAHVAQFLLLENLEQDGDTECIIRTGNPATPTYEAKLLFIPPAWILENADMITSNAPTGTGERDYALLYITATLDNSPIPARMPYLSVDTDLLTNQTVDSQVQIGGYPAETLGNGSITTALGQAIATTSIAELLTFGSTYADLFYLRGSDIGERGISGGPVVDVDGNVIGLISTKGDDALNGAGSLNAITLSYIDRTMQEETGATFAENVSGNLAYRAQLFQETLTPFLTRILSWEF
jgi:hypothetical protein